MNFSSTTSGWGPATKLVPEIMRADSRESLILYLDDDIIYPRSTIKRLVAAMDKRPNLDLVFNWGQIVPNWDHQRGMIPSFSNWKTTDRSARPLGLVVPLGVAGVLVKRTSVPRDILNFDHFKRISHSNDDLWFWCHFIQLGLSLELRSTKFSPPLYWKNSQENALWKFNIVNGENDRILSRLIDEYPKFRRILMRESS